MSAIWFRRDLVRWYLRQNPEAPDAWVHDALRTQHGIGVSAETVRRDRILWQLPTAREQRKRRSYGHGHVSARPKAGTVAYEALGRLLQHPWSEGELVEELRTDPRSLRRALSEYPYFRVQAREYTLIGGPDA